MNTYEVCFSLFMVLCLYPRDETTIPNDVQIQALQLTHERPEIFGCPIPINEATKRQLMTLPQIGSKRADQIIERRTLKPFIHMKELKEIKGIGEKRLQLIRSRVVLKPTDCLPFEQQHRHEAKN